MPKQASTTRRGYSVTTTPSSVRKDYLLKLKPQSSLAFDVIVNANTGNNETARWKFSGLAKRLDVENSVILVGISVPDVSADAIYENTYVEVVEEKTSGSLKFSVVGLNTVSIKWSVNIQAKET